MRGRWVKPEFFRDRKIAALGMGPALLYQALWVSADDGGVAPCDPDRIKGELFYAWDDVGAADLVGWLQRLEDAGRIRRYQVGDDWYAEIPTFGRHQVVSRPSKFRYPRHPRRDTPPLTEASRKPPEHSGTTLPPRHLDTQTPRHQDAEERVDRNVTTLRESLTAQGWSAFEGLYRAAQRPEFFSAVVRDFGPGGTRHPACTWDELSRALLECGASAGEVTPRKLAGFLRKIQEGEPGAKPTDRVGDELKRIGEGKVA